jgi:hypothetical protein
VPSSAIKLAAILAATAGGALAFSASAGQSDLALDLVPGDWQATDAPDPTAVREMAPILDGEPAARSSKEGATYPLLLGDADEQRLLDETLRAVEPDGAPPPAARSRSTRSVASAGPGGLEDPNELVARQLGLSGISPADLSER